MTFVVDPDPDDPADVIGDEPIWHDDKVVGWITSGGYGHHVRESIALGYVPAELLRDVDRGVAPAASSDASDAGGGRFRDRDHRPEASRAAPARAACSTRRVFGCGDDGYDGAIMMSRTQITLDPESHRAARQRAAAQGISLAEAHRRLVRDDLSVVRL